MLTMLRGHFLREREIYITLTKASPTSTVITSYICSCVLFVGLDSGSRRLDLLAVDTSPVLVIID